MQTQKYYKSLFDNYQATGTTCIVTRLDKSLNLLNRNFLNISQKTQGALATVVLAISKLNLTNHPIILCPGNSSIPQVRVLNFVDSMLKNGSDIGLVIFESSNKRYSYVRTDKSGNVMEVAEKRVISNRALSGLIYIRDLNLLLESSAWVFVNNIKLKNKFYISQIINYCISKNMEIQTFEIPSTDYRRYRITN